MDNPSALKERLRINGYTATNVAQRRDMYVYIVSNKTHRIYVGCTNDLLRRFDEHKARRYPEAFTARYTFDRLVWFEIVNGAEAAMTRERKIKHWPRAKKIALIQEKNPNWLDLSPRLEWFSSLA